MVIPKDSAVTAKIATNEPTLARSLAPEDVRVGDYVAVMSEEFEYATFACVCDYSLSNEPIIRLRFRPREPSEPLRVKAICLPFLLVKPLKRKPRTLDIRAVQLARLDKHYAKAARKALR